MRTKTLLTILTMVALSVMTACGGSAHDRAGEVIDTAEGWYEDMHEQALAIAEEYEGRLGGVDCRPFENKIWFWPGVTRETEALRTHEQFVEMRRTDCRCWKPRTSLRKRQQKHAGDPRTNRRNGRNAHAGGVRRHSDGPADTTRVRRRTSAHGDPRQRRDDRRRLGGTEPRKRAIDANAVHHANAVRGTETVGRRGVRAPRRATNGSKGSGIGRIRRRPGDHRQLDGVAHETPTRVEEPAQERATRATSNTPARDIAGPREAAGGPPESATGTRRKGRPKGDNRCT